MRQAILTLAAGVAALVGGMVVSPGIAQADPWHGSFGYTYSPYWSGYGSYYGRGGHDVVPHWHDTYTPFGSVRWYGRGSHDFRPHAHGYTPFSYEGLSASPWGVTRSYYPRYPYYYAPW